MNQSSSGVNVDERSNKKRGSLVIDEETRARIKGFLEGFVENIVATYRGREIEPYKTPSSYLSRRSPGGELKAISRSYNPVRTSSN